MNENESKKTRYFYDTEFNEDGQTIDLLSIGIVADDGREFYALNAFADWKRANANPWLAANVIPHLGDIEHAFDLAEQVRDFLLAGEGKPELWAWYAAYDHVVLCQLWGRMIDLPNGIPMFTHDVKSLADLTGITRLPKQKGAEHNALADARHTKQMHDYIRTHSASLEARS